MTDHDALVRRYATASDAELQEAARLGPSAYRPDAWRVIHAELSRRGLRARGGRGRRAARHAGGRPPTDPARGEWTPGLAVGLVPAGVAAAGAARAMAHAGMAAGTGARGLVVGAAVIFVAVWFGVALIVDRRRWWPGRR